MKLNIDNMSENKLVADVKDLKRQVERGKSTQPGTIYLSNASSLDFTIWATSIYNITCTLENPEGKRLIAIPEIAFFKNQVVSGANLYPGGANWSAAEVATFEVEAFYDWGLTDNANLKYAVNCVNSSASSLDIKFIVRWRYFTPQTA